MRILLTSESYLPYVSGVTVSVDALARGLVARRHDVMVLAPRPAAGSTVEAVGSPGPEPRYAWMASYELPRVAPPGYRMPLPSALGGGIGQARRFRPEIVHAHSPFVSGVIARRIARASGAPLVFTHHTRFADYAHYLGPLGRIGSRVTGAYVRRFWLASSAIVAPSSDLAAEIRDRLPEHARHRVVVIPTGIDVDGIREAESADPRDVAGWPPDTLVIATLGRLAPEKSPDTVLDAFALAIRHRTDLRLVLIGGGPLEDRLRARAMDPTLRGRVHVTGALPRPEALRLLAGCDLFAFASRTETQGLVLAESLACGLPAIAVDGPGVRDSVRDGLDGVIVSADPPERRPARLADALVKLADDEAARAAMSRRAREDAERFSVRTTVARTEALYRALTG